jgi:hypothetical protein
MIQKSICRDSIISNSDSTATLRRLFQQYRSKSVIAVMSAARPLLPRKRKSIGDLVMPIFDHPLYRAGPNVSEALTADHCSDDNNI